MMDEKLTHFIYKNNIRFTGFHIMVDLHGIKFNENLEYVRNTMIQSVQSCNATILQEHAHYFDGIAKGISGNIILAESHCTYHSWFEDNNKLICDYYMCGNANPFNALEVLKNNFQPQFVKFNVLTRGPEVLLKEENLKYYVYCLIDPRNKKIFYVGKGSENGVKEVLKYTKNKEKNNIIKSIKKDNLLPMIYYITSNTTEELALFIETQMINFYGDILCNIPSAR